MNDLLVRGDNFGLEPLAAHQAHIAYLESLMLQAPQVECPIRHYFAPGMWAREITIPAGTIVSGATHKTDNLIVISMGRIRIATHQGTVEMVAGDTFTCHKGSKNTVIALEDSRWTNFFHNPSNETDIDTLIRMVGECEPSELLGGADNKQLAANRAAQIEECK